MTKNFCVMGTLIAFMAAGPLPLAATGDSGAAEATRARDSARYREITIPAGTLLPLRLTSSVASDASGVEDRVTARTRKAIVVRGRRVIPAGTPVYGNVTHVQRSGRVKGRASVAMRFHTLSLAGDSYDIATGRVSRVAPGTKKQDAAKIAIPAAGGAIIGAIAGGKKGAAIGTAVGGGGGTGVVLATRGKEVRMPSGTAVSVRLLRPISVRVPV